MLHCAHEENCGAAEDERHAIEDFQIYELERQQLKAEIARVDSSMLNFKLMHIVLYSYNFQKFLSRLDSFHPLIVKKNNKSIEVKGKNSSL
ncbi:unnamed protein product [Blepharisma stoltei]|uniref:Uncharacterized protein n=1 Tax=Blepharisma stoltei TaxID=1481888 RepID=A0AAU9IMU6_9CILI|nr:unnamed protein product [Blepharisma stoltei]